MSQQRIEWLAAGAPDDAFPSVDRALSEPDGLLAAGGDLHPSRLLAAYQRGIFPWYDEGQPILWWSPDPRCVFLPGDFRCTRRLARALKNETSELRFDSAFDRVIRACAGPRRHEQGTWITADMSAAYETLHELGFAHSIEIWDNNALVGGLYGIQIGQAFFGESMFSEKSNASKFALLFLDQLLADKHLVLVDCQVVSAHLLSLGARTLSRADFVERIDTATKLTSAIEIWPNDPIPCSRLGKGAGIG